MSGRSNGGSRGGLSLEEAIERVRTEFESGAQLVALSDVPALRLITAVWPAAHVATKPGTYRPPENERSLGAWIDTIWSRSEVDLEALGRLLGPGVDPGDLLVRAQALLLVYPDGTIHSDATSYLRGIAAGNYRRGRRGGD